MSIPHDSGDINFEIIIRTETYAACATDRLPKTLLLLQRGKNTERSVITSQKPLYIICEHIIILFIFLCIAFYIVILVMILS